MEGKGHAQHHPEGVSQPQNRGCDMPCWVCTVAPLFSLPHAASSLCPSGTDGTVPNKLGVCSFHLRICCPGEQTRSLFCQDGPQLPECRLHWHPHL